MSDQPIHAAIYLRISLDREMDGLAIERQRKDCEAIASQKGWDVVDEYVDQSKSATSKTKKRPAYDKLVSDYAAGKFSAIICWDLDRLTRQPRQLEDWIDAAEDRGLLLVTANGEADLTTDGGRMYSRIKAAVAKSEVERKSARQTRAHRQRAEQGRPPKGVRPLGYGLNGDVIPHEGKAVKAIYTAFANGSTLRSITAALSSRHIAKSKNEGNSEEAQHEPNLAAVPALPRQTRTLTEERNRRRSQENKTRRSNDQLEIRAVPDDGPWSPSTVLGILRNPRYAGFSTYTQTNPSSAKNAGKRRSWSASILRNDVGEPVRGQWTAIVDEDLWWTVQEKLDDPQRITNRKGTERRHLGSGLFLCGICVKPVRTHSRRYRCAGHVMRSREQVDRFVLDTVRDRLAKPDLQNLLPANDEPRLKAIKNEISTQRGKVARAQRDYDDEVIEGKDLKRIRERAEAEITKLDVERARLTASSATSQTLNAADPVAAFDAADLGVQRDVIDILVEVRLYPHPRGVKEFNPATVAITLR
ncbi:recombinase family protein [Candidatus Microthrix sp.]|uniref:recombinase family protein n=1 Tax=Candidatus Neomicrothrix sp. TaxID=2719034 RepID=UPI002594A19D|nr:recombinase family protein [Candidatus Microthrix sp.]HMS48858.1 recombinase family protein [Candidatus Microthrix sp.]